VGKNGKRSEPCELTYVGPQQQQAQCTVEHEPQPPSAGLAKMVILSVLSGTRGAYQISDHFQERTKERDFDVLDIEYAVRNGQCIGEGKYCAEFKNHKYVFRCLDDGVEFDAVIGISVEHELLKSPLLILITGVWKTKSGLRGSRY